MKKVLKGAISALCLAVMAPAFAAPASFPQAAKDYAAGKYGVALAEFEELKSHYPTNLQVHYYEALCYQGLGQLEKARTEYTYVANANSGTLKPMAQAALQQLSRAHSSGSGGGQSSSPGGMPAGAIASAAATTSGDYKVRKVIEFYADW